MGVDSLPHQLKTCDDVVFKRKLLKVDTHRGDPLFVCIMGKKSGVPTTTLFLALFLRTFNPKEKLLLPSPQNSTN